jgi:peptidoglycan/xylan/chitin deacetylase (PgdA/CDA1 family)
MFHHFFGETHPQGQGAISAETLDRFIGRLGSDYEILNPDAFEDRLEEGVLDRRHTVLTFDDSLKCQVDVALPVLEAHGLKAYFFVYSSVFTESPDNLEIFRYFRTINYADFDDFYSHFLRVTKSKFPFVESSIEDKEARDFLKDYTFYSSNDRVFRYIRDVLLTSEQYEAVMFQLMANCNFDIESAKGKIFMSAVDLPNLKARGHRLGLHSDTHPTRMDLMGADEIRAEYQRNLDILYDITGERPTSMSHPCGRYNSETLEVLGDFGVSVGFRSNTLEVEARTNLELPRIDHTDALKWFGLHD